MAHLPARSRHRQHPVRVAEHQCIVAISKRYFVRLRVEVWDHGESLGAVRGDQNAKALVLPAGRIGLPNQIVVIDPHHPGGIAELAAPGADVSASPCGAGAAGPLPEPAAGSHSLTVKPFPGLHSMFRSPSPVPTLIAFEVNNGSRASPRSCRSRCCQHEAARSAPGRAMLHVNLTHLGAIAETCRSASSLGG